VEIIRVFLNSIFICLFFSCSSNPFWNDNKTREIKISGTISLDKKDRDVPIFVWVDTFVSHTTTDPEGYFSLPLNNSQSPSVNINGPIKVYFYVHNYSLDSAIVFFSDGRLSNEQTDFFNDGKLKKEIILKKIVSASSNFLIDQEIQSQSVVLNNQDTLKFILTLDFHQNTRISIHYRVVSHQDYQPSGIFFKSLTNDYIYNYRLINDQLITLSYSEGEKIIYNFNIVCDSLEINTGLYEVIPFLLVNQNTIPSGLIGSLGGESLFEFSNKFPQLPVDFVYYTLQISN
tara:strand:+ start:33704 stop:34567 length:864 start_codon:yes stop_codon:yes gene_type:complete